MVISFVLVTLELELELLDEQLPQRDVDVVHDFELVMVGVSSGRHLYWPSKAWLKPQYVELVQQYVPIQQHQ
jgi:hypothetical protein